MAEESGNNVSMAASITRGVLFGLPLAIGLLTILFWLQGDFDFLRALGAAALPGTLLGVFGGGFAGVAYAMAKEH
ncbi:MAG: hypothetical protein DIU67_005210 [Actinomycetes bacterium]|jgi:hypothetical protein|nr:MAG: hypothetical protein DIU67_03475 [Actinomycetota bacterium]